MHPTINKMAQELDEEFTRKDELYKMYVIDTKRILQRLRQLILEKRTEKAVEIIDKRLCS